MTENKVTSNYKIMFAKTLIDRSTPFLNKNKFVTGRISISLPLSTFALWYFLVVFVETFRLLINNRFQYSQLPLSLPIFNSCHSDFNIRMTKVDRFFQMSVNHVQQHIHLNFDCFKLLMKGKSLRISRSIVD